MVIESLQVAQLRINPANDRHGELENETAAIAWLFRNREGHMRNLARDIATEGGLYEAPLVWPENDGIYTVFDGNRRITCLKLLLEPRRAPTTALQEYFEDLASKIERHAIETVQCEVEPDRDRIDAILFRRHTGNQAGVGQSKWDDRMKSTFITRTGKQQPINAADEVEKRLAETGLRKSEKKIPRSNFNRLVSSEPIRARLGFSLKGGKFEFTRLEEKALAALARVADDLAEGRKVLSDVWDTKRKSKYLDELEVEGILPTAEDAISQPTTKITKSKKQPIRSRPAKRQNLILHEEVEIEWHADTQRIRSIWEELQFMLSLKDHPNSISVLLRVLVELSARHYAGKHADIEINRNDRLANILKKVANHLEAQKRIDAKYRSAIESLSNSDRIVSTSMMHQYVHSDSVAPSPEHLISIWDSLRKLVILCLTD